MSDQPVLPPKNTSALPPGIAKLQVDRIEDLLDPEDRALLERDLREIADQRARSWRAAAHIVLA